MTSFTKHGRESRLGKTTDIAWCDATFNGWVGCSKVSPACDFCYAETWAKRSGLVEWGGPRRRTSAANWRQPLKWHAAIPDGERRRVFCASLADVFDNQVPEEWRWDLFELIRQTPRIDWLLLTKRIGNAKRMLMQHGAEGAYNVWIGATVVTQEEADRDIPKLLETPARIRFLSIEPMLEPIVLPLPGRHRGLNWVICGGESGSHARPLELAWAADLLAQCAWHDIAFFMKQMSQANWPDFKTFESFPPSVRVREFPA
jgi:protein gp37